jgi:hydroxymethylpyrimidine/phosphomethylpyrimidine kinase
LTVAGSDSGGGAGIQADLKTISAFGCYGASVITAVTAQNTLQVSAVEELPPPIVRAQIEAVLGDIGADAVKIGMLANAELVRTVAEALRQYPELPIVLDPVMIAKSGDALLRDDAVRALSELLVPLSTLVTPNLPEAARLTGLPVASDEERVTAARQLGAGGAAVLIKGGHGDEEALTDLLYDGESVHRFTHPRLATDSTHGTGCTLSSAIACGLGRGRGLREAVEAAIAYLQGAIAAAFPVGKGHGPVDHLYRSHPVGTTRSEG